MQLVLDDSYFPTNKSINTDNATVIACILLPTGCKELLVNIMEDVMQRYGLAYQPIKYCLDERVLEEYQLRNRQLEYHSILRKKHPLIINEILKKTSGLDYQLIVGWNYIPLNSHKVKIGKQKIQNTSDSFINVIQEASHHYKTSSILSDRFDKSLQALIDKSLSLWAAESIQKVPLIPPPEYHTGCSFHSRLLQFADIIVGILRKMIQSCVKGQPVFTPHCAQVIPKLLGFPNKISEKGLFGPPEYQKSILEAMKTTLDSSPYLPKLNQ